MRKSLRILLGVVAVVAALMSATFILAGGRQLAFGDGFAPSPDGLTPGAQAIVVLTWAAAGALASWLAAVISRGRLPSLIAAAIVFQAAWLSPGVRPREILIRLLCSVAVALAGFAALVAHRYRVEHRLTKVSPKPAHG